MNTYLIVVSVLLLVLLFLLARTWKGLPRWYRNETIKIDLSVLAVAAVLAFGLAYCARADANHETIPGINEMFPLGRVICLVDKDKRPMFVDEPEKDVAGEVRCLGMKKADGTVYLIFERADNSAFEMWLFDNATKKRERVWRAKKKGEVDT